MNQFAATLATLVCCTAHGHAQAPLFAPASPVVVGPGSGEVFLADIDRDGHLDLLTKHLLKKSLSVRFGDGKGTFTLRSGPPIDVGFPAAEAVAVDVNADKKVDLVVATVNIASAPFASKIVVLLGDGHGGFAPAPGSPYPAGPGAYRFAVAEVNADGKPDIAASSFEGNAVTLLLGR